MWSQLQKYIVGGMSVDKKNQSSKSQYGTMTAKFDANQDYTSSTQKTNTQSQKAQSKSEYGTLTAKADANNDYTSSNQSTK